jgi:HEAT repeat protein
MSPLLRDASDPLEVAWNSGNEDVLVQELRAVKSRRTRRGQRERTVMEILDRTGSTRVRNAAALALADMRAAGAAPALVDLLGRDDARESGGTLLYALEQIGAMVPLDRLTDILVHGGYEAREEALGLMTEAVAKYGGDERRTAQRKLQGALGGADEEHFAAIRKALKYLSDRQASAAE